MPIPSSFSGSALLRRRWLTCRLAWTACATLAPWPAPAAESETGAGPAGVETISASVPPGTTVGHPRVFRSYRELWALPGDQQQIPQPIEIEYNVAYADPRWMMLFLEHDGTVHYMETRLEPVEVRAGDRVLATGTLAPAIGFQQEAVQLATIGRAPERTFPHLHELTEPERAEARMVVLDALVNRQQVTDENHLFLELSYRGAPVATRLVLEDCDAVPALTGALVRVCGVYNPARDISHGALVFEILVARVEDIEVRGWLAIDPAFDQPPLPIAELGPDTPARGVRVVGTVEAQTPGRSVTLRDATGQVVAACGQTERFELGSPIEVVGMPVSEGLGWRLEDARCRRMDLAPSDPVSLGLSLLRMVDQVLELPEQAARLGHPVQLVGVVTWSHPDSSHFFILDSTGGVRVTLTPGTSPPPEPGHAVAVNGHSRIGPYAPEVAADSFVHVGTMALPEARNISFEQAFTGLEEAQWVSLRGYLRAVGTEGPWARLEVSTPGGDMVALAPRVADYERLVGATVVARGVCTAIANERRQLTGIRLWVPTPEDVQVEEAAPADPFAQPLRSIANLRRFNTLQTANQRLRLAGTVTHHMPGRYLYLQDAADALLVLSRDSTPLNFGDRVEVVGLPGSDNRKLVLREAVFRRIETGPQPGAVNVPDARAPDPALESRLVSIEGRLLEVVADPRETRLILEEAGAVFEARLAGGDAGLAGQWTPQSRLSVTGIYAVSYDEYREPRGFVVELRTQHDIAVLERPSWLTASRALTALGVLGVGLFGGLAWVVALRRRVRQQTGQLRLQLAKEADLRTRQHDIVENASDFIFATDLGGRFTAFNPAGERITGFTRTEALTMHLRDLFLTPEDAIQVLGQLRSDGTGGATFRTRFRTRAGEAIWVEISSRLILDGGHPAGVLGIVRDVSERKKFEEQLEAARDTAQASAQAKSIFLANMSHEIRTPMNGVIGMANLLLDTRLDADQRDFAETIRGSAEALLTILNDILDFSKIEAGRLEFESVAFDLVEAVEGTLDLLATRASAKGLELLARLPADLQRRFVGDPGRLRQVLLNLVGNAIKFTHAGQVLVDVSISELEADRSLLRFEIIDSGIGLSEEAQSRLFQPFSQADSSTTRRFGGTGLGLAISRQIVELMSGTIGVHSAEGAGSTFWFTARLALHVGDETDEPSSEDQRELRTHRVLCVDDNPASLQILESHLQSWGMSCTIATGGAEALAAARAAALDERPFDFAIIDQRMPEMDGSHAVARWRADASMPQPKFVLMMSADNRLSADQLSQIGVDQALTKPIRREELRGLFHRKPRAAPAGTGSADDSSKPTGIRVLVVEDNVVNQRVARLLLQRMGVVVDVAGNGLEAIKAIERTTYGVVFMDCQMPVLDGFEATRRLRADGVHATLPVIAMTANAMEGDRDRCLRAGMTDYVSKPMRPDELRAALRRCGVLEDSVGQDGGSAAVLR